MLSATMKFSLSSVCAAVLLSACSFAPTYERPAAPVPSSFPAYSGSISVNTEGATEDLGWSDFFKDPRLQAIIALALDNSRDMRIAVERVQEARAQYGVVRSEQFPSIGLGATGQVTRYPEDLRVGGPGSPAISKNFQAGIGLTAFEIDLFGRLRNLSAAALEQYLATESTQRAVRINVVSQVAESYFRLRAAQEMQTLMRNTEKSRSETLRLVQLTYDVGTASALDLNQANLQLQTVRADLEQARRNEIQALNALTLLTGTELPIDLPEPKPFGPDQLVTNIPVGLPSYLLQRRPDLIAAEHALRASNASIGAARAAFFPSVSITGLLGFASPSLSNLFGSSHHFWQYSPQVTMPIFTGGSVQSGLDLAEVRKNIAVAQYERSIQNAFKEVADALAGEATYSQQLEALRAMIRAASASLEIANLRYETGIDSFLQVQTAEINLYSAQQIGIQEGLNSLLNRIELYKSLGGGWGLPETANEIQQASVVGQ